MVSVGQWSQLASDLRTDHLIFTRRLQAASTVGCSFCIRLIHLQRASLKNVLNLELKRDSMGEVSVPALALLQCLQTQRAVENFPVSGWRLPPALERAIGPGQVRLRGGQPSHEQVGRHGKNPLTSEQVEAMLTAALE